MGGGSSKERKTNYDVSHSVDGETVSTNIPSGSMRGSKKKGSIKVKKKSIKKSKSFKNKNPEEVNPDGIKNTPDQGGDNFQAYSQVNRKNSSCPSCDAKDILLGKNRSRSDSKNSLRFSDFNKALRKTRIYDWEMTPPEIPLYDDEIDQTNMCTCGTGNMTSEDLLQDCPTYEEARRKIWYLAIPITDKPQKEEVCYICEVYTGSLVISCRVCCRVYHVGCLSKIGHQLRESSRCLIEANRWSCHQCASLNHLLTKEEVKSVQQELADLNICKENITEVCYLNYCKHVLKEENKMFTTDEEQTCISRFHSVATKSPGVISFSQFLNLQSVRILKKRCKDSLVHLLAKAELTEARKMFQMLDTNKTGTTTKSAVQALLSTNKLRAKNNYHDDSIMYIDEDQDSPVTWSDFLRDTAIYFLGQRPNKEDTGSDDDDTHRETLNFSSCNSLDVEDDTCDSDLDAGAQPKDLDRSDHQNNKILHDSRGENPDISTMLEEIDSAIDKRHELRGKREVAGNGEERSSSLFPQTPAELCSGSKIKHSPSSVKSSRHSSMPSGYQMVDKDSKTALEKGRSSPFNDSRHSPIPWGDVEKMSGKEAENQDPLRLTHRRSEVIQRQNLSSSSQSRAVSQAGGCRYGRSAMAPAYGNLVGRVNTEEWRC